MVTLKASTNRKTFIYFWWLLVPSIQL